MEKPRVLICTSDPTLGQDIGHKLFDQGYHIDVTGMVLDDIERKLQNKTAETPSKFDLVVLSLAVNSPVGPVAQKKMELIKKFNSQASIIAISPTNQLTSAGFLTDGLVTKILPKHEHNHNTVRAVVEEAMEILTQNK